LAYAGFYLTRKSFAVAKVEMGEGTPIGLTTLQMSWIDGSYLTAYAIGQFVWGVCGDKLGTRRVVLAGMLASVAAALAMGASTLTVALGVCFCIQGVCQSTGWAPLTKNIAQFFSHRERGRAMGWWCTSYAFGGFIASVYGGWACQWFGWRFAFWIPAATLFVIWLLFFLFQRNRPEDVGLPPIEEYHGEEETVLAERPSTDEESEGSWKVIFRVVTNPTILLLSAVYFLLKPTRYLILFWAPVYLNKRLGTGAFESGVLGAAFELAGPLGVLAGGYLSDKVFHCKRIPISVICLFVLAPLLLYFDDLPPTRFVLGLGFFAIGFFIYVPDSLVSGTAAIDFGTKRGASTAAGLINGFGSAGAIIGGMLPGLVQRTCGKDADLWNWVFVALAASILLAGLLLLPKWNALPPTAGHAKGKACEEEG